MGHSIIHEVKKAIREKYAWPGGYELIGILSDGASICTHCMKINFRNIAWSTKHHSSDGWQYMCTDVNWENPDMYCCNCNKHLLPEYSND